MSDFSLVVQGPVYPKTQEILEAYNEVPYISEIIFSTWEKEPSIVLPSKVTAIFNPTPSVPGGGNINYQLLSSKEGIQLVNSELTLKVRSDLLIARSELDQFVPYFKKTHSFDKAKGPRGKILTPSISPNYAYFTWDFLYFGFTEDLKKLFMCEQSTQPNYFPDLTNAIVPETYITACYIAQYDAVTQAYCANKEQHLIIGRSGYNNARQRSIETINNYFTCLPNISVWWTKHYSSYCTIRDIMIKFGRRNDYFATGW